MKVRCEIVNRSTESWLPENGWAAGYHLFDEPTGTLVVDGGKSPAWMRHGMQALAEVLPNAKLRTLKGQTHMVQPKVLAPLLTEFFAT